jgi:hypothetical protein
MIRARYVRSALSAVVAGVVILFGCVLAGSVIAQSSLILGAFSFGSVLTGFGAMQGVILLTVEGGLVFLMVAGGAKVVLSQKLVRFTSYPQIVRSSEAVGGPVRIGGVYRGARRVGTVPAPRGSRRATRPPVRVTRASP